MSRAGKSRHLVGESFVDLSFVFGEYLWADLASEWYYSYPYKTRSNVWGFLDLNTKYEIITDRLCLFQIGGNLLDTRKGRREALGERGYSLITEELIPGVLLVKANLRF